MDFEDFWFVILIGLCLFLLAIAIVGASSDSVSKIDNSDCILYDKNIYCKEVKSND